jgi:hypothetical protein
LPFGKKEITLKSILDSSFRYTSSSKTDLKKTFARIRRQQKEELALQAKAADEARNKILTIDQVRMMSASTGRPFSIVNR